MISPIFQRENLGATKETIAVVDDEPMWRRVLVRMLEGRGMRVLELSKGRDLIERIREPSLICLDLGLEDMMGLEVLEQVKARRPDVPVIVATADHTLETAVRAMRVGAIDYVTKPFNATRFHEALEGALNRMRHADRKSGMVEVKPSSDIVPLSELEKEAIQRALSVTEGHVGRAAKLLGIGRATLYRRLTEYGGGAPVVHDDDDVVVSGPMARESSG